MLLNNNSIVINRSIISIEQSRRCKLKLLDYNHAKTILSKLLSNKITYIRGYEMMFPDVKSIMRFMKIRRKTVNTILNSKESERKVSTILFRINNALIKLYLAAKFEN